MPRRVFAALVLASSPTLAQAPRKAWTQVTVPGAAVDLLAVGRDRPDMAFIQAGALYRTEDGGSTWSRSFDRVDALAILPGGETVLASTHGTVFRSVDGGARWSASAQLRDRYGYPPLVGGLVASAADPGAVYALAGPDLYRSRDAGSSWERFGFEVSGRLGSLFSLAEDPRTPSTLFAAAGHAGFARSRDGGVTWEPLEAGLEPYSDARVVAVDPSDPSRIFAGGSFGLVRSIDGGAHFTGAGAEELRGQYIDTIFVSSSNAGVWAVSYFGSAFRSRDRGETWEVAPIVPAGRCALSPVRGVAGPGDGRTLWAGSGHGAVRSNDSGSSWFLLAPVESSRVLGVFPDPASSSSLFATTSTELFRSEDGGATWKAATTSVSPACAAVVVVGAGSPGSRQIYGSAGNPMGPAAPFLRSQDSGATWDPVLETFRNPVAILVDPLDPNDVYVSERGETPEPIARPGETAYRAEVMNSRPLVARSREAGARFVSEPLLGNYFRPFPVLARDPAEPATIWAGGNGLFRRRADGPWVEIPTPERSAWKDAAVSDGTITGLVFDPGRRTLTIATDGAGVFRSQDAGASWKDVSSSLPSSVGEGGVVYPKLTGLVADPAHPEVIFASAFQSFPGTRTVYRSQDGGDTWVPFDEGLPEPVVESLWLDARTLPTLWAVTPYGLYALDLFDRRPRPCATGTPRYRGREPGDGCSE